MKPRIRLSDHTTKSVPVAPTLLLIPLGSTEQHGPHLPLSTDSIVAEAWASRLAEVNTGVVVAPVLAYGSAGEHQSFAGTFSIGQEALTLVLVELARSARHHYDRVVFVSGHAGNLDPIRRAISQLRDEGHDVAGLLPVLPGADAHAGRAETSLMLHLRPDLVDLTKAEPGNTGSISSLLNDMVSGGVSSVSSNGILGDPSGASATEGIQLLEVLAAVSIYDGGHC